MVAANGMINFHYSEDSCDREIVLCRVVKLTKLSELVERLMCYSAQEPPIDLQFLVLGSGF